MVWIIVMFFSAVWTLILTAPIHIHWWYNATFLRIWWRNKLIYISAWGRVHLKQIFIFGWIVSLKQSGNIETDDCQISTLCENRSLLWNIANTLHYKSKVWTRLTEWMICDLKNLSIQTLLIVQTYKVNAMEPNGRKRIIKHLYITCSSVSKHPMMHLTKAQNDHSRNLQI